MLAMLCSCTHQPSTAAQIYFDTVVEITADCSDEVLSGAFSLCRDYENILSRTKKKSEVSLLSGGKREVSADTLELINKGLYYSDITDGKFDITLAPLSDLWDFKNEVVPSRDEISEALKNVDYQSVKINGNTVDTGGKSIDLGGIAKGYVADKLLKYLTENGAGSGIINLGGNVTVFGNDYYNVGIKKPFTSGDVLATLKLKNKTVSTSGIYERYFKSDDGKLYHHILDTKTGYPAQTDLYSASVIGDTSVDCDALSTICILYGLNAATRMIEESEDFEAVFVDKDYNIYVTSGLEIKDGVITLTAR